MSAQLPMFPPRSTVEGIPTCHDFAPGPRGGGCGGDGHPQCVECGDYMHETVDRGVHRATRIGWLTSIARLAAGRYVLRCLCGAYVVRSAESVYTAKHRGSRSKCQRCRIAVLTIQKRHLRQRRGASRAWVSQTKLPHLSGEDDDTRHDASVASDVGEGQGR